MTRSIVKILLSLLFALALTAPAFAKCPVSDGATVAVRAGVGDLLVETSARDSAEVQIENNAVQVQEICSRDLIEFVAAEPERIRGTITWRVIAPKTVNLDLVTMAGNITVGDVDGDVLLRTAGGSITAGNIRGKAAITTQGGFIRAGNIGGNAELRSKGGTLEVGDIGGNAELYTTAGVIRARNIVGSVTADGGRTISIIKAREVKATTNAGDISIGDAVRINAKSGGGNITSQRVSGPFEGHTESGDIRLDSAGAWVEASTRLGNILVRLVPVDMDGDLHMKLDAGTGDVTVYLPQKLRASIETILQRPGQIVSDIPIIPTRPQQGLFPNTRFYTTGRTESFLLNGGGSKIVLNTSLGKITIRKN